MKLAAQAPYRLLEADDTQSYGDLDAGNMIVQGDNLEALKALLPLYAGKIKCICIDPPYNVGSAFEHYDDNLEHSIWLSVLYPRLELLREFLSEDGSIWVTIDSRECHYLKVIMDEIFYRKYFIAEIIWQKRTSRENRAAIGSSHDTVLVYSKMEKSQWKRHRNLLPATEKGYSNPDNDPRGVWKSIPFTAQGYRKNQMYPIVSPSGSVLEPPKGRCWGATEEVYLEYKDKNLVYFPRNGKGRPRIKQFVNEQKGFVPMSIWFSSDVGDTEESKKEILDLFSDASIFDTPKPERLIWQILSVASGPNDLVLDSFLGSGTTAAVAHKMGRKYIGIEIGDHAITHCVPRLKKVIDGEQGGISKAVNWQGGGGFRFFRLGEAIFDDSGKINPAIRFPSLAAHIWFCETRTPLPPQAAKPTSPLLGIHEGTAYYLLFNGILGDKSPGGGNVLTNSILRLLPPFDGPRVIYGERCLFSQQRLKAENITFKHIPYDIKAR